MDFDYTLPKKVCLPLRIYQFQYGVFRHHLLLCSIFRAQMSIFECYVFPSGGQTIKDRGFPQKDKILLSSWRPKKWKKKLKKIC